MTAISSERRIQLLERLSAPPDAAAEAQRSLLYQGRRIAAALSHATRPEASAEMIAAAQRIAERLIGAGGEISPDLAELLRAVLEREVAAA